MPGAGARDVYRPQLFRHALAGLRVVRKVYDCNFPGSKEECACDGMASCTTPLEVPLGMDGDLVLFYELGGFKQNHRRYKPSFAPQHGQTPRSTVPHFRLCPSSGRAWWLWAARYSHGVEARPLGAQPLPWVLGLATA